MEHFSVEGHPKAQPRVKARAVNQGGKWRAFVYTPTTAKDWKLAVAVEAAKLDVYYEKDVPLEVRKVFLMPRPKSHYGSRKGEPYLKDSAPKHPTTKPDLDNLEKAVWDALNEVLWHDDAQVVKVYKEKQYAELGVEPGLMMWVQPIG